jgi:3-oxoadipate enol-lactonase
MPQLGRLRYLEALPAAAARPRGTLILLHAFPLNARMWEGQLVLAERGWHVIAPQFRGVDGAAGDPPTTSIDDYAGDVIDLLDALHVKEAVVGGLSMGGYAAFAILRLAARYVQALILADTRPQADTPEGVEGRKKMLQLVQEKGPAAVADEMMPKLLGETTRQTRPEVVERVRSLVLASSAESIAGAVRALMTRPDSTPLLAGIHVPTLILVGADDTVTPPALSEEMHRAIGGSELVRIDGAGHLSNLEQPALFNAALARFLDHRV